MAAHQARSAVRIVDDLFDLCAGRWDRLPLHKELVELAEVVRGAAAATAHRLAARGHRLSVSLPPKPLFLIADPLRLEQVLTNLLTNATKFTDPGGHIQLTSEAEARHVVLRVRDNGRGIASEQLLRVFDPFWQAPGSGNKGTRGLGLALVKSLVELHGGCAAAHSDGPGTRAEFTVRLPTGAHAETGRRDAPAIASPGLWPLADFNENTMHAPADSLRGPGHMPSCR
jgi:signal transduction histidine kinase